MGSFGRAPLAALGGRAAAETIAKRRENTNLPLCHAPHGHSRMSIEEVLQQSPQALAAATFITIHAKTPRNQVTLPAQSQSPRTK